MRGPEARRPGGSVDQREALLKGRPETGMFAAVMINRMSGDGHLGLSLSGVSCSAFGSRLRAPAADGRDADARVADSRARHPSPVI